MSATMQALVVLEPNRMEIREVAVPVPGPNEVLARVRAVSICGTDVHLIRGDYPGFWPLAFPFIPGHEWAGEIVELGPGVELYGWKVGDRVAGTSHDACGVCQKCVEGRYNLCENYGKPGLHKQYGHNVQGADAEYIVQGVKTIFPLPAGLSFDTASLTEPLSGAWKGVIQYSQMELGDDVVVIDKDDHASIVDACRHVLVIGEHHRASRMLVQLCFGRGKSAAEIRALARENFRRIGENFASAIKTAVMTPNVKICTLDTFKLSRTKPSSSSWSINAPSVTIPMLVASQPRTAK